MHGMKKWKLLLWSMYDFANSIVFVNFLVYFPQWLVSDGGISDFAYNSVFPLTALLLLFIAPGMAAYTDRIGHRKIFLNIFTIGTAASYFMAALMAIREISLVAFLFFAIGQMCYQMSFIFFDPLLNDLADKRHRGRASGIGQFANSLGMIIGMAVSIPLVAYGGGLYSLIPACAAFVLFALPMMIFYHENKTTMSRSHVSKMPRIGFDWKKFRAFIITSAAAPILVAFFFYTNALNTITGNYSIYADKVLGISGERIGFILIVVQIAAAIGALSIGLFGDKLGARKCLFAILWTWMMLIPLLAMASSVNVFFVLAGILGFTIGAGWAVSRAYVSQNLEKENTGYGFSFYALFERFSVMIGPLCWGGILTLGGGYRAAMMFMSVFIIAGLFILFRMRTRK